VRVAIDGRELFQFSTNYLPARDRGSALNIYSQFKMQACYFWFITVCVSFYARLCFIVDQSSVTVMPIEYRLQLAADAFGPSSTRYRSVESQLNTALRWNQSRDEKYHHDGKLMLLALDVLNSLPVPVNLLTRIMRQYASVSI
jgi:hypothetical protein